MKIWMITFPFLLAAGLAAAADPAPKADATPEAVFAAEQPAAVRQHKTKHHQARNLPKGDLRQCLELKDNKAIIACSEKRQKK